jgi:diphthamide biosynthesis methyltransferase
MTVNQACEQILDVIETRGEQLEGVITPDTLVVGIARVGHEDQVESRM